MYGTVCDYYESAEDIMITDRRALEELCHHNIAEIDEFYRDLGKHDIYRAQDVLRWLGY